MSQDTQIVIETRVILPTDHLFKPFFPERTMDYPVADEKAFENDFESIVLEAFAACGYEKDYISMHLSEFKRARSTGIWCYYHNDGLATSSPLFTVIRMYCDRTVATFEGFQIKKDTILSVEFA